VGIAAAAMNVPCVTFLVPNRLSIMVFGEQKLAGQGSAVADGS
jgi:hypothetical protein